MAPPLCPEKEREDKREENIVDQPVPESKDDHEAIPEIHIKKEPEDPPEINPQPVPTSVPSPVPQRAAMTTAPLMPTIVAPEAKMSATPPLPLGGVHQVSAANTPHGPAMILPPFTTTGAIFSHLASVHRRAEVGDKEPRRERTFETSFVDQMIRSELEAKDPPPKREQEEEKKANSPERKDTPLAPPPPMYPIGFPGGPSIPGMMGIPGMPLIPGMGMPHIRGLPPHLREVERKSSSPDKPASESPNPGSNPGPHPEDERHREEPNKGDRYRDIRDHERPCSAGGRSQESRDQPEGDAGRDHKRSREQEQDRRERSEPPPLVYSEGVPRYPPPTIGMPQMYPRGAAHLPYGKDLHSRPGEKLPHPSIHEHEARNRMPEMLSKPGTPLSDHEGRRTSSPRRDGDGTPNKQRSEEPPVPYPPRSLPHQEPVMVGNVRIKQEMPSYNYPPYSGYDHRADHPDAPRDVPPYTSHKTLPPSSGPPHLTDKRTFDISKVKAEFEAAHRSIMDDQKRSPQTSVITENRHAFNPSSAPTPSHPTLRFPDGMVKIKIEAEEEENVAKSSQAVKEERKEMEGEKKDEERAEEEEEEGESEDFDLANRSPSPEPVLVDRLLHTSSSAK